MTIRLMSRDELYWYLIARHFTHAESREFSTLGRISPALKLAIETREESRRRFEKQAVRKIDTGAWTRRQVPFKWLEKIKRMYRKNHWLVKTAKPKSKLKKGDPNPWKLYKYYEQEAPPEDDYIPRRVKYRGKAYLERGMITVKKAERGIIKPSPAQLRQWVGEKRKAVRSSTDQQRKIQLRIEIKRLEALL